MGSSRWRMFVGVLVLTGCPGPTPPSDGGAPLEPTDGGVVDGGAGDAGTVDSGAPDAGVDGGADGGVVFLDWREVRGAPLAPVVEAERQGNAFGLFDDGYAIESACDAGRCTYSWYGSDGGLVRQWANLTLAASDPFSTDGTKFVGVEVTSSFVCSSMGASLPLVEGTWGLHDARTGERLTGFGPLVTDPGSSRVRSLATAPSSAGTASTGARASWWSRRRSRSPRRMARRRC